WRAVTTPRALQPIRQPGASDRFSVSASASAAGTWEAVKNAIARSTGPSPSAARTLPAAASAALAESSSVELADAHCIVTLERLQDLAGDHHPLDLARALADLHQLRVA